MISENRELGGKKGDPCMLVAGRKKKSFCSNSADELGGALLLNLYRHTFQER